MNYYTVRAVFTKETPMRDRFPETFYHELTVSEKPCNGDVISISDEICLSHGIRYNAFRMEFKKFTSDSVEAYYFIHEDILLVDYKILATQIMQYAKPI